MPDTHFKPLPRTKLKRGVPCYLPKVAVRPTVDANSPALKAMTDFSGAVPITVSHNASLDEANRIMALCHVHYLLVADDQRQLLGLVTEAGSKGHRPLAAAQTLGVRPGELVVGDIMIKKHDDAEVMHLRDVAGARVGNVVARSGRWGCLTAWSSITTRKTIMSSAGSFRFRRSSVRWGSYRNHRK